jgi:hypothetical protein
MFNLGTRAYPANRPELKGTLWFCGRCHSFITVHSAKAIDEALCPICMDAELDFCGTVESILGSGFADA